MTVTKGPHDHPIGTEASRCPRCGNGILFFVDCIGTKNMVLECANCRTRFYKDCGCELYELTEEMLAEIKEK